MAEKRPKYGLKDYPGKRGSNKPTLLLVQHFQVREADYMKPPLTEQLLEPDGRRAPSFMVSGVATTADTACTCNVVCTCVPVMACACNTVCNCNTVSTTYTGGSIGRSNRGGGSRGHGGGYGGYWAPCF